MDRGIALNKQKIEMWRRAALDAQLKASCAYDPTTEKLLLDVAAQYEGLIDQETASALRAKIRFG